MDSLKKVIKILIGILVIVIAIKFFIYALPFIIVLLLGYLIYMKVKENNNQETVNNTRSTNKKSKVIEGEVVKENIEN